MHSMDLCSNMCLKCGYVAVGHLLPDSIGLTLINFEMNMIIATFIVTNALSQEIGVLARITKADYVNRNKEREDNLIHPKIVPKFTIPRGLILSCFDCRFLTYQPCFHHSPLQHYCVPSLLPLSQASKTPAVYLSWRK